MPRKRKKQILSWKELKTANKYFDDMPVEHKLMIGQSTAPMFSLLAIIEGIPPRIAMHIGNRCADFAQTIA